MIPDIKDLQKAFEKQKTQPAEPSVDELQQAFVKKKDESGGANTSKTSGQQLSEDEKISQYNQEFEQLTGAKHTPVRTFQANFKRTTNEQFQQQQESPEEKSRKQRETYNVYKQQEQNLNELASKVMYGNITGDELQKYYSNPYTKKLVTKAVQDYSPSAATDGDFPNQAWDDVAKNIVKTNRVNLVNAEKENISKAEPDIQAKLTSLKTGSVVKGTRILSENSLPQIDFNDQESVDMTLRILGGNTPLYSKAGDGTVKAMTNQERVDLMNQIERRLSYDVSTHPLDPDVASLKDVIHTAITDNISSAQTGHRSPTDFNLSKSTLPLATTKPNIDPKYNFDQDAATDHFMWGLAMIKKSDVGRYNNVVNALKKQGKIADSDWEYLSTVGQGVYNEKNFRDAATNHDLIGKETNYVYQGASYQNQKAVYSAMLGEEIKKIQDEDASSGHVIPRERMYSTKLINIAAKRIQQQTGYSNPQLLNDLTLEEGDYDAIPKTGAFNTFERGVVKPLFEAANSIKDLTHTDAENYLRSQRYDVGMAQKVPDVKGNFGYNLPSDRGNIVYDMLDGAGQFLTYYTATKGIGGGVAAATGVEETPLLSAAQKASFENAAGTIPTMWISSYGSAYEDALKKTGDYSEARLMGGINATVSTALMVAGGSPFAKIGDKAAGIFSKEYAQSIVDIVKSDAGIETIREKARPIIGKFVGNVIKNTGTIVGINDATNIADYITESIISPKTAANRDLGSELLENTKATAINMMIPSMLGAGGETTPDFTRDGLHHAALNLDGYSKSMRRAVVEGNMTQDQYNKAVKILKTHQESLMTTPVADANNRIMTASEIKNYAFLKTKQKIFEEQLKNADGPEKELLQQKITALDNERRQILFPQKAEVDKAKTDWENEVKAIDERTDINDAEKEKLKQAADQKLADRQSQIIKAGAPLNDVEKKAVGVLSNVDLSKGAFAHLENIIKDPATSHNDKRQALKEISDQLTDPNTALATEEHIGRSAAEAIYDLNYKPVEQPQTEFERLNLRSTQLHEELNKLNDQLPNAETEDAKDEIRKQREDVIHQLMTIADQMKAAKTKQPLSVDQNQTGRTVKIGNDELQITGEEGDNVTVFNPTSGETMTMPKEWIPKETQADAAHRFFMDKYGVGLDDAAELKKIADESQSLEEFKKKATDYLSQKTNLGTSQADIDRMAKGYTMLSTSEIENISQEDYDRIKNETAGFIGKEKVEIATAASATVDDAKQQLENDGGVVWQEFPNRKRIQGGQIRTSDGQVIPGADNGESRSGPGNEALHRFGFGLHDGSGEPDVSGKTLSDIMSGEGFSTKQRGMAAAYIAALRLLHNEPTDFISRIFSRAANRSNDPRGRIRIMYNENAAAPIISASENGTININAAKLGDRLMKFGGEKRFNDWLEAALTEEVTHLATFKVATADELEQVARDMSENQKQAVKDLYKDQNLSNAQLAGEYLRQVFQEKLFGTSTELLKPNETAFAKVRDIARRVLAYIKKTFQGENNPTAKEIINRLDNFVKDKPRVRVRLNMYGELTPGKEGELRKLIERYDNGERWPQASGRAEMALMEYKDLATTHPDLYESLNKIAKDRVELAASGDEDPLNEYWNKFKKPRYRIKFDKDGKPLLTYTTSDQAMPPTITGINEAIANKELAARGLSNLESPREIPQRTALERAQQLIESGEVDPEKFIEEITDKLLQGKFPFSDKYPIDVQVGILNHQSAIWKADYYRYNDLVNDAKIRGDAQGVLENMHKLAAAAEKWDSIYKLLDSTKGDNRLGTELARGLSAFKMFVDLTNDKPNLVQMDSELRAAIGGSKALSSTERAFMQGMFDQMDADRKAFDEYRDKAEKFRQEVEERDSRRAAEQAKTELKTESKTTKGSKTATAKEFKESFDKKVEDAAKKLSALFNKKPGPTELKASGDEDVLKNATEMIKSGGVAAIDKAIDYLKNNWDASQGEFPEQEARNILEDVKLKPGKRSPEIRALALQKIKEDPQIELDDLVDAVREDISGVQDLSHREVRDLISGYTREAAAKPDEIKSRLSELRRQGRLVSEIEDVEKGLPLLEGKPFQKASERVKELRNQLEDLAREKGLDQPRKLAQFKNKLNSQIEKYQDMLDNPERFFKDKADVQKELELDKEGRELLQKMFRTRNQWRSHLRKHALDTRTKYEKTLDTFVKWERAFKLTYATTIGKLTSAAVIRLVSTPVEEAVGGVVSALMRGTGLGPIVDRAYREGGFNTKAEMEALTDGFTKGLNDSVQMLTRGEGNLEVLERELTGKGFQLPAEWSGIFGRFHGFLKSPVKRAEFARSMAKRTMALRRLGIDPSDPMVQTEMTLEAIKDAKASIFMQSNKLAELFQKAVSASSPGTSAFLRFLFPFVTVPSNIVLEASHYAFGLEKGIGMLAGIGVHEAAKKVGATWLQEVFKKGMDNIEPAYADKIIHQLKKGIVGTSLIAIGYFNPQLFGGYYRRGEKRKKGALGVRDIEIPGVGKIPGWLIHSPMLEMFQLGATIRKVSDEKITGSKETKGIGEGTMAGLLGLFEEIPFIGQTTQSIVNATENHSSWNYFLGEMAKGSVEPGIMQEVAQWFDPKGGGIGVNKRKPKDTGDTWEAVKQHLEMGIPGLRENVPLKK